MRQISIANAWGIFKINFHLVIRNNLLLAIAYLLSIPIIRGIANLDAAHAAECLEQSVALIGIILIVPIHAAEQSKAIREIVYMKRTQPWKILLLRFVMSLLALAVLTALFAGIMKWNHCQFPYIPYVAATLIREVVLGSIGLLAALLCNSAVIGYFVSMGCFLLHTFGVVSAAL